MDVKVSVIIPVYNAEKYLEQCLDSVIHQSLYEIEVICVDDGSSDKSMEILERYQKKDPRITVFKQSNSGVGSARNSGLKRANGEFVVFLDSDDFYMPGALEKLYNISTRDHADICVFGMRYFNDEHGEIISYDVMPNRNRTPKATSFNISDYPDTILNFAFNYVWNKMYRHSFLTENNIIFPDLKRSEDLCFIHMALCLAKSITVLRESLITYRFFRQSSLTSTVCDNPDDIIESWFFTAEKLKEKDVFPERSFLNNILGSLVGLFKSIRLSWPTFERVFNRLKNDDLIKLGLVPKEPGYYYDSWQEEVLQNIFRKDAYNFILSFVFILEIRNRQLTARKNAEIERLKQSIPYRIGEIITWVPKRLREFLRRIK